MKVVGIIAEYNPFHSGHAYQLQKARELSGADFVIVAMSGDFVQRGEPAIFSKRIRAQTALLSGADLVLELPVRTSTSSAEGFARGGVELLDALGCVDTLSFGTECTDTALLQTICHILCSEPDIYKDTLHAALQSGCSFPAAREKAILSVLPPSQRDKAAGILQCPNTILALEYMRSIHLLHASIHPVPVERLGSDYHAKKLEVSNPFTSATSLRHSITKCTGEYAPYMATCMEVLDLAHALTDGIPTYLDTDDLDLLLGHRLLESIHSGTLDQYMDISPELANRIENHYEQYRSFEQFCFLLKNKSTTYTHVSRALTHILLGLYKQPYQTISYAHVLGFRKDAEPLLKEFKHASRIPLITSPAKADSILPPDKLQRFEEDIHASALYQLVYAQKYDIAVRNEYREPLLIIE